MLGLPRGGDPSFWSFDIAQKDIAPLLDQGFIEATKIVESSFVRQFGLLGNPVILQLIMDTAIVFVLETYVASCKALWEFMADKAKEFIGSHFWDFNLPVHEAMICIAGLTLPQGITVSTSFTTTHEPISSPPDVKASTAGIASWVLGSPPKPAGMQPNRSSDQGLGANTPSNSRIGREKKRQFCTRN
ncbi:hypothetical protein BX600DRAFT_435653 [Xylariales sp. PMI_506]|nr:hypothetical protein BX600DRAFT_435653 [Xylariales sp. PMI_506]